MKLDYKKIADVVDALTGFEQDQNVVWIEREQTDALKAYMSLIYELVDRYSRFITKKSEYFGRRENLYDYDGEASRALAKLGKQIVDDLGCI